MTQAIVRRWVATKIALILACWTVAAAAADSPGVEVYEVDAAASDVHWRIYRAGAFSRLGHNHVISVGELSGVVKREPPRTGWFELIIPVAGLIVDDPELRARYGDPFDSAPSANDVAGTRRNMLGRKVLDAKHHPVIRVVGTLSQAEPCELAVTVELRGRSSVISAPCELHLDDGVLIASGEFSLTHAGLGLKPFKVMFGALAVAKRMDFSYRVQAIRSAPEATATATGRRLDARGTSPQGSKG